MTLDGIFLRQKFTEVVVHVPLRFLVIFSQSHDNSRFSGWRYQHDRCVYVERHVRRNESVIIKQLTLRYSLALQRVRDSVSFSFFLDPVSEEDKKKDDNLDLLIIMLPAILGGIPVIIICACCFRACCCKVSKKAPPPNTRTFNVEPVRRYWYFWREWTKNSIVRTPVAMRWSVERTHSDNMGLPSTSTFFSLTANTRKFVRMN